MRIIQSKQFKKEFGSTDQELENLFNFFGKDKSSHHMIGKDGDDDLAIIFDDYES